MKKKIIWVLLAVLVVIGGYCLYMEYHFDASTVVTTNLSSEQIRSEMPDIAFTEEDDTMVKALLAATEITEAFLLAEKNENGVYTLPLQDASELLKTGVPEGFEILELTVTDKNTVYVSFLSSNKRLMYSFDAPLQNKTKTIGIYGKDIFGHQRVKAVYQNQNGEITKYKEKHLWFEWLKETRE